MWFKLDQGRETPSSQKSEKKVKILILHPPNFHRTMHTCVSSHQCLWGEQEYKKKRRKILRKRSKINAKHLCYKYFCNNNNNLARRATNLASE